MPSEELQKKCKTHNASGDADLLIVLKAIPTTNNTMLYIVGDDTDLIILLCYYASLESHDLFLSWSTILIECTPVCGNCRGSWCMNTINDSDEDDENDWIS